MADHWASKPGEKPWTFVNSKGEEEDVDYESSCSSSSSSGFVKIGCETVTYQTRERTDTNSGPDISNSSDDELNSKESTPTSVKPPHVEVSTAREDSPGSEISDVSLLDDLSSTSSSAEMVDVNRGGSADEGDSDLEIIPHDSQEVLSLSLSNANSPSDSNEIPPTRSDFSVESVASSSTTTPLKTALPPSSSERSGEVIFVLRPRLESTGDSDSDFSQLETQSSPDQSEPDEILQQSEEEMVSSVGERFRFVADDPVEQGIPQEGIQDNLNLPNDAIINQQNEAVHLVPVVNLNDQLLVEGLGHEDNQNHEDIQGREEGQGLEEGENQQLEGQGDDDQRADDNHVHQDPHADQGQAGNPIHHVYFDDDIDDDDVDTATESGAEDDRIESDQSDWVPAEEDADLSFSTVGLENISLHEINLSRQYVHKPNKYLSGTLSLVVIMTCWMALGLGIGHSLGSTRPSIYLMSITHANKILEVQDNLYLCLRRKTDILSTLHREREDWEDEEDELNQLVDSHEEVIDNLKQNIEDLKVKVNDLEQQRADLVAENGRLKYNKHPANQDSVNMTHVSDTGFGKQNLNENQGKDPVSDEAWKNREKQHTVELTENHDSEFQDFPHDSSEDSEPNSTLEWENQTEKLREELTVAKDQANMWQLLYLQERQRKVSATNSTPDFLSCLSLFSPKINFSEVVKALNKTIKTGIKNLPNITEIRSFINRTLDADRSYVVSEIQAILEEVTNLWLKWRIKSNKSDEESQSEQFEKKKQNDNRELPKWKKNLHDFLNKTQESVSHVSQEIQKQWKVVQNYSSDFLKKNQDKAERWHSNVINKVSKMSKVVKQIKVQAKNWFNHKKSKKRAKKCKGHGKAFCKSLTQLLDQVRQFEKYKYKAINKRDSDVMIAQFENLFQHKEFAKKYFGMISLDLLHCQVAWWKWNAGLIMKVYSSKKCAKLLSKWQVKRMKKFGDYPPIFYKTERSSQATPESEPRNETDQMVNNYQNPPQKDKAGSFGGTKRRTDKGNKIQNADHRKPKKENEQEHKEKDNSQVKKKGQKVDQEDKKGIRDKHGHKNDFPKDNDSGYKVRQDFGHKHQHSFGHEHGHSLRNNLQYEQSNDGSQDDLNANETEIHIPNNNPSDRQHHSEDSWFVRKMEEEEKQREGDQPEKHHPDNWLFARAEERDFHRNRPDNWYFRRADGKHRGKYCITQKVYEKLHRTDDDFLNKDNQYDDDDYDYGDYFNYMYDFLVCYSN